MFPAEPIPDGNIMAPHHLYLGLGLNLCAALLTYYAFKHVWPRYPRIGATLTLVGLAGCATGVGIALDDALSHAFGIWTPLDSGWKAAKDWLGIE